VDGEAALTAWFRPQVTTERCDPLAHPDQTDPGHRSGVPAGGAVVIDLYGQGV
jgi:hypothetical protein